MVDLKVDLGSLSLKNPVIPASGTFGYGEEFLPFLDLDQLGALVLKGIYLEPRPGNPPPRIHETSGGLLNSIGLAGPGTPALKKKIRQLALKTSTPVIVNVCGSTDDEYLAVAREFDSMDEVSALELNISCPNVHAGGACPAQNTQHTRSLVASVKKATSSPLMVKLSPNVSDIGAVAAAAEQGGADMISLVNTFLGMAVDLETQRPVFNNIFAGLSGPAVKPIALRMVWEACRSVKIPVIGMGGIFSGRDALEFILAGAAAVQTGTVNLIEPAASIRIIRELRELMVSLNIDHLDEIRGRLKT